MSGSPRILDSSALKVNLERTAVDVAIPERYAPLLEGLSRHFGLQRKAQELLTELNHPFVNWEHVLAELKAMAIGEFHTLDAHEGGLAALAVLTGIFEEIIRSDAREEIREDAVHGLFDCLDALLAPGDRQEANEPLALSVAENLHALAGQLPGVFVKASAYAKRIVQDLQKRQTSPPVPILLGLLFRTLGNTYRFWLDRPDPVEWLSGEPGGLHQEAAPAKAFLEAVAPIGHGQIQALLERLASIEVKPRDIPLESLLADSLALPDFFQIANAYLRTADQMESLAGGDAQGRLTKMDFLFHVIRSPWLTDIHSQALREINRCLKTVLQEETAEKPEDIIRRVFRLLQRSGARNRHRGAVMDCIKTLAVEVFDSDNHALVNAFLEELVAFGFEGPERKGPSAYWQVQANPGHVMNLRVWLGIIAQKPRWTKPLLSALIVNLKLGGLFVRDTDLIQKDISALLASDIGPAYNLVKQLLRLFPVYHNEIGAEGELRDISTRVDDLSDRRDRVVNFLRKQSHVDSNSLLVGFMEDIFRYWASGDKTHLRDHLPEEVYEPITAQGDLFDDMHRAFSVIMADVGNHPTRLLNWDRPRVQKARQGVQRLKERDRERTQLMIRLYQLLTKKYYPQYVDLLLDLERTGAMSRGDVDTLRQALARGHHYKSLTLVLKCLSVLKARILDPKPLQYEENIYYKRHVAADIPSMYGTYREEKFDALGLSLRLESLGTMLFEEMAASLNLKFITKRTIIRIHGCLWLFIKALELEGISIEGLVSRLKYVTSSLPVKTILHRSVSRHFPVSVQGDPGYHPGLLHRCLYPLPLPDYRPDRKPVFQRGCGCRRREGLSTFRVLPQGHDRIGLRPPDPGLVCQKRHRHPDCRTRKIQR
jgi:pyruvate,orthophosphate dikinase